MLLNILKGLFNRTAQVVQLPALVSDDSRPMETRVIAGYAEIKAKLGENSVSFWMNLQGMRDQVAVEAIKKGWTSYEAPLPQLIASWSSGLPLVFVDIGANSGYYSLLSAAFGARSVIAFEPAEEIANLLDANIKRSQFEQKIQAQRVVFSDKSDTSKICYSKSSDGFIENSTSLNSTSRAMHDKIIDVVVNTLKMALETRSKDNEKILLKIDLDGCNIAFMQGATRIILENRPGIIVKLLPGIERSAFFKFLKNNSYTHFSLNKDGYLLKEKSSEKNINEFQRDHLFLPNEAIDLWLTALEKIEPAFVIRHKRLSFKDAQLTFDTAHRQPRLIFFLAPFAVPFGGVATILDHVRILSNNGISAWVAMPEQPQLDFYQADVSTIIYKDNLNVSNSDICIFPEGLLVYMSAIRGRPARKLMLCQNYYYLPFTAHPDLGFNEYQLDGVIATCVANRAYLQDTYKLANVPLIPYAIDTKLYHRNANKIRQIAFMPRKLAGDIAFIRHSFLRLFPEYSDIPWFAIDKMPKYEAAAVLAQSAVFLSLSDKDPLGLPPLEAMASGCVVAGFHGGGGLEYMTPANGWWADTGDWRACVNGLAAAVATFDRGGPALAAYHAETQRTVETYSVEGMTSALLSYWRSELARLPAQSVAATAS